MLSKREQLMEDIDCIIESNFGEVEYKNDVIRQLCNAVCKNFPTQVDSWLKCPITGLRLTISN